MRDTAFNRLVVTLALGVACVFVWSGIRPFDRLTWGMEVAPVALGLVALAAVWPRFRFTPLACVLIAAHMVILLIGGKYTYAEVPLFNWLRDTLHLARNHYDRVGHLAQGFIPAIVAREILLRASPLQAGKWLFAIVVCACLAISAAYELIEWQAAVMLGSGADAFLATQGDPWDTQKDMALALLGAILAQALLARVHDRQLAAVAPRTSLAR